MSDIPEATLEATVEALSLSSEMAKFGWPVEGQFAALAGLVADLSPATWASIRTAIRQMLDKAKAAA